MVRLRKKVREYAVIEILENSLKYAAANRYEAEECGEGSYAVRKCFEYLESYKEYQWRLSLMYDIQYLKQRKLLQRLFIDILEKHVVCHQEQRGDIKQIITRQNVLLAEMYGKLRKGEGIEKGVFDELAEAGQMIDEMSR